MDKRETWGAGRLRTERVRVLQDGPELDGALRAALANGMDWGGVSIARSASLSAVAYLEYKFPDRVEDFEQRLLGEVAPWATLFDRAIELGEYDFEARREKALSPATVLRILTAEPAAIVRAIILAIPEREP